MFCAGLRALLFWCAASSSSPPPPPPLYLPTEGCSVLSSIRNITPATTNTLAAAAVHFSAPTRSQSEAPRREQEACQRRPCCTCKRAVWSWFCWTPAAKPDLRLSTHHRKGTDEIGDPESCFLTGKVFLCRCVSTGSSCLNSCMVF